MSIIMLIAYCLVLFVGYFIMRISHQTRISHQKEEILIDKNTAH